jgi:hypothetical protein
VAGAVTQQQPQVVAQVVVGVMAAQQQVVREHLGKVMRAEMALLTVQAAAVEPERRVLMLLETQAVLAVLVYRQ